MARTRVVNINTTTEPIYINVGRPTKWGNPYIVGKHGSRDEVCDMYEEDFLIRIVEDPIFRNELEQLRGKVLACHCKPKRCHADIIARYLNSLEPEAYQRRGRLID